ncbi:unnamed protein product [Brachionus calyciflorus]|uniref:Peptidase M12B domain-containing protein n=1 Tax=Brachionus calyciflorus TaxID=104777 RepID=A0A814PZH2_9BILA|nr:unnamed protein product [Brachionus calyciflorus]
MNLVGKEIVGYSPIGGICSDLSYSIVQDTLDLSDTISHEISHNLGAYHDGSEKNSIAILCQNKTNTLLGKSLNENAILSNCSIQQIKKEIFVPTLPIIKEKYKCLSETNGRPPIS